MPSPFRAVGLWYRDFPQATDDEVHDLLAEARREREVTTPLRPRHRDQGAARMAGWQSDSTAPSRWWKACGGICSP